MLLVLAVSWLLRILLIHTGGELFWPDEKFRYGRAYTFLIAAMNGEWSKGNEALWQSDHTLFAVFSLLPASLHLAYASLSGTNPDNMLWLPASIFALASVLNIAIVYAISRRLGGSTTESIAAAVLMASSATMFYYARNFVPYDFSMALLLSGLWFGLDPGVRRSSQVLAGVLSGLGLLTYYGSWYLVAIVLLLPMLVASRQAAVRTLAWRSVCLMVTVVTTVCLARVLSGGNYLSRLSGFSKTVEQGDFAEGWSHPWAYLWYAEHSLLLLWIVATLAVPFLLKRSGNSHANAGAIGLAGACGIYATIVLSSTVLHVFVAYGRLDRQMVPFLCLGTAWTLFHLPLSRTALRCVLTLLGCLVFIQAAFNFAAPMLLHFPRDIRAEVERAYGPVCLAWTVANVPTRGEKTSRYVLYNASMIWPMMEPTPPVAGRVLFSVPHPLQRFVPYQYEQFTPRERSLIRQADLSMRLIDTAGAR